MEACAWDGSVPTLHELVVPLTRMRIFRGPSDLSLSSGRLQQLSLDYTLPIDVGNDEGYTEQEYPPWSQPVVVPGGNRDFFGINNNEP